MSDVERLLAVIAEGVEHLPVEDRGVGIEFFEPARDWLALLAEVKRLREQNEEWRGRIVHAELRRTGLVP